MEVKRHRLARTDTRIHKYAQNVCHHTHHSRCASDDGLYVFFSSSSSSSSSSSVRKQTNRGRGQPLMAKKQSWTAREIQTKDSKQKEIENSATPIDSSKITVPKVMQEKDFWDDEMFESVGDVVGKWGLVLVAVFAAISGIIASKTYNEGAVEVDFTAYDSPEEAVAASVRVAAAPVKKNSVVSAPTVVGEDDVVREVIVE